MKKNFLYSIILLLMNLTLLQCYSMDQINIAVLSESKQFQVFQVREKNFIKKYISDYLGSMQLVVKFFNKNTKKLIFKVDESNLHEYQFNKDESRLSVIK